MHDNILNTDSDVQKTVFTKSTQAIINGNENNISIKKIIRIKIFTRTAKKISTVNINYNRLVICFKLIRLASRKFDLKSYSYRWYFIY